MGLFDFLRRNLLVRKSRLKMETKLLFNLILQMIALQDGKPLMQNLIVSILISPIPGIMEHLSNICLEVQILLMVSVFMMRGILAFCWLWLVGVIHKRKLRP